MPEQPQLSWAERIAESKKNTFKPLDTDTRYNFEIDKTEVKESTTGKAPYIKVFAKVIDGERKNYKVNFNTFPESANPWSFLQLFEACGFGLQWLQDSNPNLHEIASALVGRPFSAEVVDGNQKRDDGTFWPEYQKFSKPVANEPVAPQAPAASNFGSAPAPAPAPQAPAPTPAPQPQEDASPWGTPAPQNGGGMSNPFNDNF